MHLHPRPEDPPYHRKTWEYCAVAQALFERGKLQPGMRALGFAVGVEPLPALFARHGVDVLATDVEPRNTMGKVWGRIGQHPRSRDDLYRAEIVDRTTFDEHVRFRYADMNGRWPFVEEGSLDFVWSCCAFEHLGSLERGLRFVQRSSKLLKKGGVAVHTTEYNVTSNTRTVRRGKGVIYRRRDIEELDRRLRYDKRCLAKMDFDPGEHEFDRCYDVLPYAPLARPGQQHVKLCFDGFVATSMLLVVIG
jgi:SAM-dependent methyltransferase